MIDEVVKIHDNYTFEMKVGFVGMPGKKNNQFKVNTWFFVPGSLDINRHTYKKEHFYKDIKTNIRLITPVFSLQDIADGPDSPLVSVAKSIEKLKQQYDEKNLKELEYEFKMVNSILKSSLRNTVFAIKRIKDGASLEKAVEEYIRLVKRITVAYRAFETEVKFVENDSKANDFFAFGDEFMCLLIEIHSFKLLKAFARKKIDNKIALESKVSRLIKQELAYKQKRGYLSVQKDADKNNKLLILRHGILKKYIESELFLNTIKKEDGFLFRQFIYSLAAGVSMIFATIVAFSFQQEYGNFTIPFFIALVLAYMLKDRIKELSRFYFAHKLNSRYFDLKTVLIIGKDAVGVCRESFDYIANSKVPADILKRRNRSSLLEANNNFTEEQVLLYRMQVQTNSLLINKHTAYELDGINTIIRYTIASLTHKMDNPEVPLYFLEDEHKLTTIKGEKVYFLNMLIHMQHNDQDVISYYRLVLNRDGIKQIEKIKA